MHTSKLKSGHIFFVFPILLALYEFAMYLSNDAYLPALPDIAHDLRAPNHLVQLTLTTWFIGGAWLQLLMGPLCDRIGRRPVLFTGGLIFVIVTVGCAITQNIHSLLLLRFLQGSCITSMIVAGYSTIHDLFDRERAIHTLSIMGSITIVAPSFGPLFGALIMHIGSWRWIFGLLAIWVAIVITGMFLIMPETQSQKDKKLSFQKTVVRYKNIFTNKPFMLFLITPGILFLAMIAWISAGPFLLIEHFHFNALFFGMAQVFIFGALIITLRLVKRLMKILTLKNITLIGISLSLFGGMYAFLTSWFWPTIPWNMIIGLMFLASGSGLVFPIFGRIGIETSDEPMAAKVAITSLSTVLFGALGSALISGIYNNTLFFLGAIIFVFSIFAAIFWWVVRKRIV
jgi:Bcr/CflA subfamily drug resistance transporter